MRTSGESGEGKLSNIVALVIFAGVLYASWNLIPIYYNNYSFSDRVNEIARLPRYNNTDEAILQKLAKESQQYDLHDYISPRTCAVVTQDYRRSIKCSYERQVKILPGLTRTLRFDIEAEQPLL
jgi:hypothetical protein